MAISVSIADVRELIGIGTDIISDDTITSTIASTTEKTLDFFNVFDDPTKVLEIQDGNGKSRVKVNKPYLVKLLELKSRDTDIDIENTSFDMFSSIITVDNTLSPYYFYNYFDAIRYKYLSGFMQKTNTISESTDDTVAGTSVAIAVDDETGFATGDWVMIEGLDNKREAAQITGTDTLEITVDQLVQTHEAGSVISLLRTHNLLNEFVAYESAVASGINSVGASYTFATGYTLPEYAVQKGVPYPHFEKTVNSLIKQRDIIKAKIFNKLVPIA